MPVDHVLTWDETGALIEEGTVESLAKLGRTEEQLAVYNAFMAKIKEEFASNADFILINVFERPMRCNAEGKKHAVDGEHREFKLIWRLNDFPYNFEPGMEHWLLWCTKQLPPERIVADVGAKFPDRDVLWFVNPVALQSVTAVWHAHIITRPKQPGA